ncbi:MAG: Uma2 family endonuclease [Anaerolineae bacterium]|nr:Uma2 family endonuclease [Anaerolineae bacterium]
MVSIRAYNGVDADCYSGVLSLDHITVDQFAVFLKRPENRERRFELIHGEIVERVELIMMRGLVMGHLVGWLYQYLKSHDQAGRAGIAVDYCVPGDRYNFRTIDVSHRAGQTPVVTQGCVGGMPDFAAEVKTLDMSFPVLREKARYYLTNGTRLVWLVIPEKRLVEVYTPDDEQVLTESDVLSGGDVLPGFTLPVRDVFVDTAVEQ